MHGTRLLPKGAGERSSGRGGMLVLLLRVLLVGAWVQAAGARTGLNAWFPKRLLWAD